MISLIARKMKRKFAFGVGKLWLKLTFLIGLSGNAVKTPHLLMPLPHPQQLLHLGEQMEVILRFSPKHMGLQFHISV